MKLTGHNESIFVAPFFILGVKEDLFKAKFELAMSFNRCFLLLLVAVSIECVSVRLLEVIDELCSALDCIRSSSAHSFQLSMHSFEHIVCEDHVVVVQVVVKIPAGIGGSIQVEFLKIN